MNPERAAPFVGKVSVGVTTLKSLRYRLSPTMLVRVWAAIVWGMIQDRNQFRLRMIDPSLGFRWGNNKHFSDFWPLVGLLECAKLMLECVREPMQIGPGESQKLELKLPAELAEKLEAGAKVAIEYGRIERVSRGNFQRSAIFYFDNVMTGTCTIRWEEEENWIVGVLRSLGFLDRNNHPGLEMQLGFERVDS
jgi:hypothetical protein